MKKTFLSVDLGAGSGRVIAAIYDGAKITMEPVTRFENTPVELGGHIYWNVPSLISNIRKGLSAAREKYGEISAVGVDTWGVDYALLDRSGRMLSLPYAYRDVRNSAENMDAVLEKLGARELYNTTGIQFMEINTLFQLHAEKAEQDSFLSQADKLLFMPDLINYLLCGEKANEMTIASTSQMIDVNSRNWAFDLIEKCGISKSLLSTPVMPGTLLGKVRGVRGLEGVPLAVVGSHDTASAVASVPSDAGSSWGYLSTGTWALLGVETEKPVLSDLSYNLLYTHEGAVNGNFRYLKNCTGMWIVQELRRAWSEGGKAPEFDDLMREAQQAEPFKFLIDPDYSEFQSPGRMPEKIAEYCTATGQPAPQTKGEFYRAAMESIVMRYREVWGELKELTGVERDVLHMIGGATKDEMHCRMTTDALGVHVATGPAEGASMGNALAQMLATGDIGSFEEGRQLIRDSIDLEDWQPENPEQWDEAFAKWQGCREKAGN